MGNGFDIFKNDTAETEMKKAGEGMMKKAREKKETEEKADNSEDKTADDNGTV